MLLLIAGGAIAVAAIAVAVIVLSNRGGSNKQRPTIEAPLRAATAVATYKGQVAKALTPLVTANQTLSSALGALDGSQQATNHAKTAATQAATALSAASGGISVLTAPTGAGNLPGQVQQLLTADNGYLQAVVSTLQSPTVSGAGQLDTLATGAQSAFDGVSTIIPAASSSVTGSSNLANWASSAANSHKAAPATQTVTSSASAAPSAPSGAPPSPGNLVNPSGGSTDCGSGLIAGSATTCNFSENVQEAWDDQPNESASVTAYSPATGIDYTEYCQPDGGYIYCTDSDESNSIWWPN
jgi:hypothetical protein